MVCSVHPWWLGLCFGDLSFEVKLVQQPGEQDAMHEMLLFFFLQHQRLFGGRKLLEVDLDLIVAKMVELGKWCCAALCPCVRFGLISFATF